MSSRRKRRLNKEVAPEKTRVSRIKKVEIGQKTKGSLERQVRGDPGVMRCTETKAGRMRRTAWV